VGRGERLALGGVAGDLPSLRCEFAENVAGALLRQQHKRVAVRGLDGGEVAAVEGEVAGEGDRGDAQVGRGVKCAGCALRPAATSRRETDQGRWRTRLRSASSG
jgi:hypothetical protein